MQNIQLQLKSAIFYILATILLAGFLYTIYYTNQCIKYKEISNITPITFPISLDKRYEAAKELENYLRGAKLSKVNRFAINRQIISIGIKVEDDSSVSVLDDEDFIKFQQELTQLEKEFSTK